MMSLYVYSSDTPDAEPARLEGKLSVPSLDDLMLLGDSLASLSFL